MSRSFRIVCCALVFAGAALPGAFAVDSDLASSVDACVAAAMDARGVPGASVAVAIDGQIAYEQGYGVKHREQGGAVGARTLFRTGSVQKMMTAAAVMAQVDRGLLAVDERIVSLVPELRMAGPWPVEAITIEHLLTHRSAVPDLAELQCSESLTEWIPALRDVPTYAPAGSFYNYSNAGYSLLGLAAERASGVPYATLMREAVWEPAGMNATFASTAEAMAYRDFAYGHAVDENGAASIYAPDAYECPWSNPAGDAFTTAGDLVRFALQMLDEGGAILSRDAARAMLRPRVAIAPFEDLHYAYGIMASRAMGVRVYQHDGGVPGWGSHLLWIPRAEFAVAVVDNGGAALADASACVAQAVTGIAPTIEARPPRPPQQWQRYVGIYDVRTGESDRFPVLVERGDDALLVTLPHPETGEIVTIPALPAAEDAFFLDLDGNEVPGALEIVQFVRAERGFDRSLWLVNRAYVGRRSGIPAPRAAEQMRSTARLHAAF